jgi:UDP-N-acetylmuramoyl-L-alanyl-D-glutamate--2,6-diaminopimelate ligase
VRLDTLVEEAGLATRGLDPRLLGDGATPVTGIAMDTRQVEPGHLFACVPGSSIDGHLLAPAAVEAGAAAVLCEHELSLDVPQVVVASVRRALGPVSDAVHGHPSAGLVVAGVTGTNGKTTTCAFLAAVFEAAGWPALTIGTLTSARTTPEAPDLHASLARWRAGGGRAVAMEVSSHALHQHRTDAVRFAAAVFTNLSPEHLDYHPGMDAYFEAKARLFDPEAVGQAVVNSDDEWGRRLLERIGRPFAGRLHPFSPAAATGLDLTPSVSRFRWEGLQVELRVGGRFNVANAVAAAATARALGIPDPAIAAGLDSVDSVPGRFQLVDAGQPFTVVVDYAHTPDGLEQLLSAARQICAGRLIAVFGAGGDRDREKRPLMGMVAAGLADLAVVTSDNPRSEDPEAIIAAVMEPVRTAGHVVAEADRAAAIATALGLAQPGDVVVIAGKGHEKGQEVAGRVLPFDDVEVARAALARIAGSRT